MTASPAPKVALLYPGDRAARDRADPAASRFAALFEAFAAAGVHAEPAVWHDDFADEVRAQLRGVQAVLVWCNPIEDGRRRDRLDALLREVAHEGVLVSAHPEAIQRLGTKDVLFETRDLPFGSDVHRIDSLAQLASELPQRLRHGARVLKQHRGHSGIGVWRVEQSGDGMLTVQHAQRGSTPQHMDLAALQATLAPYFEPASGGHMIDQAWQPRLAEGMVRAYLVEDRVAGFGLRPSTHCTPRRRCRGRACTTAPNCQSSRRCGSNWSRAGSRCCANASAWRANGCRCCGTATSCWARRRPAAHERFVLCEINVSSVSPFPPSTVAPLVNAVSRRLGMPQGDRR